MSSKQNKLKKVGCWGTVVSVLIGLVLWGRVSIEDQLGLLSSLTEVASAVFIILGIWLSVQSTFCYGLGRNKKDSTQEDKKIESNVITCETAFCFTVIVVIGVLALRFILAVFNDLQCEATLYAVRIVSLTIFCLLLFLQVVALFSSVFLVLYGFHDFLLKQERKEAIRQVFSNERLEDEKK